jgi:RNA polymerase sigma-70 factor (ECF subfamily)
MDELTLLRRLDADAPTPSRQTAADAFAALEQRMAAAEHATRAHAAPKRRQRVVRLRWAVLATAGAAVLAAALVLTDTVGVAGLHSGASAQAAELLNRVADTTIRSVDPTLQPGQYRKVVYRSVHAIETGNQTGATVLFSVHEDRTTWIPANLHDEWTEVRYPGHSAGQYWGKGAKWAATQADKEWSKHSDPQVLHGKEGKYFGNTGETPEAVNALPRDARVLLNHIYRVTLGSGTSPDDEALVFIADTLNTGYADAATRAALYRAAALIPGVTLTADSATLNGTTGVAIGRVEPKWGIRQDLIIDPTTGTLIGERRVSTRDLPDGSANKGDTIAWSAVTSTVVDDVPAKYEP